MTITSLLHSSGLQDPYPPSSIISFITRRSREQSGQPLPLASEGLGFALAGILPIAGRYGIRFPASRESWPQSAEMTTFFFSWYEDQPTGIFPTSSIANPLFRPCHPNHFAHSSISVRGTSQPAGTSPFH